MTEPYKIGERTTDVMLEILNLDKKEVISIEGISNQEFSEVIFFSTPTFFSLQTTMMIFFSFVLTTLAKSLIAQWHCLFTFRGESKFKLPLPHLS